jgi:hypothetical protein
VRTHPVLLGECLGGALYVEDFVRLARAAGFQDPRKLSSDEIKVGSAACRTPLRVLAACISGGRRRRAGYGKAPRGRRPSPRYACICAVRLSPECPYRS